MTRFNNSHLTLQCLSLFCKQPQNLKHRISELVVGCFGTIIQILIRILIWTLLLTSVAVPVLFFRIRIRIHESGFSNTDPDPGDPKKTWSDRIGILLRYVFDVYQDKYFFLWHFLTKSKRLMTLKITDKKYLDETVF